MALTIYSTPKCEYCKLAKEFCKERHIEYCEVDVAHNRQHAEEMRQKSGQATTPVIVIPAVDSVTGHEEVIVGFNRDRLTGFLGL